MMFFYFRPGEEARMLARCQFGTNEDMKCGATFTYPIKGYPWRRNVMKGYEFDLSEEKVALLFSEVHRIKAMYPQECLVHDQLWSDHSEKGNAITRDRETGTLCHYIAIYSNNRAPAVEQFSMRETSVALLNSSLFRIISGLIAPYEKL